MTTRKKTITRRTAERLSRAAYDFEYLATRFRADGMDSYANSVAAIASQLGNLGRSLDRHFDGE